MSEPKSNLTDDSACPDSMPMSEAPVTVGYTRVSAYRIGEIRHSSAPPLLDEALQRCLTSLLLAAAHADGGLCRRERHSIRKIHARLGSGEVPAWLNEYMVQFDPEDFDLQKTALYLRALPPAERRYLAELVREVSEANNVFDLAEERFLLRVIEALGLYPHEHKDLVMPTSLDTGGVVKRLFDIVFASVILVVLLPVLLGIALGVKLSSPGKVLFKQRRYGKNGAVIEVFKFRSMRATENGPVVTQARRSDPRVTPFGAFLRRSSLDELPQFINVLLGDMSVVGPRPHAVAHNEQHRTLILEYMLRHKVKPGITGWAQVNGFRGETDTLEKMIRRVECDLQYIRRYSFWFDLQIIWLTVFGRKTRNNAY
jgi:putative colanic acid biosynthesis UDP-glucose lipid carrier transferase